MGAGTSVSWFPFASEEATLVLLRLHDARNLGAGSPEEVAGVVRVGADQQEAARLRCDAPAQFTVGAGTTVSVDFFPATGLTTPAGTVQLPLEHIARRCGGSLYHMWLPVEEPSSSSSAPPAVNAAEEVSAEQFDRLLRTAARDPLLPMVCVSLCQADAPHADKELYEISCTPAEKAARFWSLLQSHAQHARLLQALYRQSRLAQQARNELDASSQMLPQHLRDALGETGGGMLGGGGVADALGATELDYGEEIAQLQDEIESTTAEANSRIHQASDAIRTLKERLANRQAENEVLQQDISRLRREAVQLEIENERLALRIERRSKERPAPSDREEELRRLRREANVLVEQKEALLLILDDLYGAAGVRQPQASGSPQGAQGGGGVLAPAPEQQQQTWQNMLPRPSELFASGVLDDS